MDESELQWEEVVPLQVGRLDASCAVIGCRLYMVGGICGGGGKVSPFTSVLNMALGTWEADIPHPPDMAHSHLGVASDGCQHIYITTGQWGPNCMPAVTKSYVLDISTGHWSPLPELPCARYAPAAAFWRGRFHVAGGSAENRCTPARDHWSLAISGCSPGDGGWRREAPIPRGGPHRAGLVFDDKFYVFGGQEGDYKPIEGDENFACTRFTREVMHGDCFRLLPGATHWERIAPLPIAASHIECSIVLHGEQAIICGGCEHKDLVLFDFELSDAVQAYDFGRGSWRVLGRLPYRCKTVVAGAYGGWLYACSGQRDIDHLTPFPGEITAKCFRTRLDRLLA